MTEPPPADGEIQVPWICCTMAVVFRLLGKKVYEILLFMANRG